MMKTRTTAFFLIGSFCLSMNLLPINFLLPQFFQGVSRILLRYTPSPLTPRSKASMPSSRESISFLSQSAQPSAASPVSCASGVTTSSTPRTTQSRLTRSWPNQLEASHRPPCRMGRLRHRRSLLRPLLLVPLLRGRLCDTRGAAVSRGHRDRSRVERANVGHSGRDAVQGYGGGDECLGADPEFGSYDR